MFVFFIFPLVGLVLDAFFETKKLLYALGCTCLMLVPAAVGYSYTFSWGLRFFCFVGLCCLYALFSKELEDDKRKKRSALLASGFLIFLLGCFAFIDSFSGSQTVEQRWKTQEYKVEYIRDQGFAGGPKMTYELSKYSQIPFLIKKIETTVNRDTTQSCKVVFNDSKIVFDKCKGTIERY